MSDIELKPCPFCNNKFGADDPHAFIQDQGYKWAHVNCCSAEVRTGYQESEHWKSDAIEAWNKRPIEDALQAKIDSLMLEYCPDEMTDEQLANWEKHQRPVSAELQTEIDKAMEYKP